MQKIVIFTEPNKYAYQTSSKLGSLFMNRLAIDEDDSNEVLKIEELKNSLFRLKYAKQDEGLDCEYR